LVKSWYERGQYANTIKEVLEAQVKSYKNETDSIKKTKIAQSIGYLGQIVNSLIRSQEEMGLPSEPDTEITDITEDVVKKFVRYEILEKNKVIEDIGRNELLGDIIKFKKSDMKDANLVLAKMEQLGLKVCMGVGGYNLGRFGKLRGYVTDDEYGKAVDDRNKSLYGS